PDLSDAPRPLVERAWASAKIVDYTERMSAGAARGAPSGDAMAEMRGAIVALSLRHRVVSPYTALLVLETEEDYAPFGIDRRALADLLVVDGGRLALKKRAPDLVSLPRATARRDESKEKGLAPMAAAPS